MPFTIKGLRTAMSLSLLELGITNYLGHTAKIETKAKFRVRGQIRGGLTVGPEVENWKLR
jgi:hypothetical protein